MISITSSYFSRCYTYNTLKIILISVISKIYRYFLKPILFKQDPEIVHKAIVLLGEVLGRFKIANFIISTFYFSKSKKLKQQIAGISFKSPIGLAAGFDYEGRLTQSLAPWGFGFQTIGTITNMPYKGNPRPILGRLPKSLSLMVNKGFKNPGAKAIIVKLNRLRFPIPVGISIGRTNSREMATLSECITDIISAFKHFENSRVSHSYYELNISCPNLYGDVTFYPPKNLSALLSEIDKLQIKRPIFIKMPIEKTDKEVLIMLNVIAKHSPTGVIFGNLQKNRNNPSLVQSEVSKFPTGNFSGKPTYVRSNELISLAYKNYKDRFIIIGCGGIFSANDAYEKIKRGASVLQLITGLIFVGPQLVAQINSELIDLLKNDGFENIKDAVGSKM